VPWQPFEEAKTIGAQGSEEGVIVRDEAHESGARITLETGCRKIPFAITCGIPSLMVHTVYASSRERADSLMASMRVDLEDILALVSSHDQPGYEAAISEFVRRYE
jgi:hypothetical protein